MSIDTLPTEAPLRHVKPLTKGEQINTFIRSWWLLGSFNYERMQAIGFCVAMMPAIKKFWPNKEDRVAALQRHLEFFNTQPWIGSTCIGVTAAMEEQRARGEDIDDATISAVKIGLMGPLAGVGDPIYWGTARPVLAALGASFALSRNFLGPLIFFVGMSLIRLGTRWYTQKLGYERGTELMADVGGNQLRKITQGATILGLFVMGALVSRWTSIKFPAIVSQYTDSSGKEVVTTVQTILDSLLPGAAALGLTFLCMWLLRKGINPIWLIFGMFALGIIGYGLGILAP